MQNPNFSRRMAKAKPALTRKHGLKWWFDMNKAMHEVEDFDGLPQNYKEAVLEVEKTMPVK